MDRIGLIRNYNSFPSYPSAISGTFHYLQFPGKSSILLRILCIPLYMERKSMRNLALSDEILLKIEKPARYIGNEVNAVMKAKEAVSTRFCMCFPDVYEIGMSHLGIQILYDMFNQKDDVWCERVYSPWPDLAEVMKEKKIPLFALESQDPIKDFDFLGITIQYEMCYTNILQVLDLVRYSAESRRP